MINSVEKTNLAYAYACAVKAHQGFAENHSCIKGATIVFELIQGIEWYFDRDQRGCGYIGYTEKPSTLDQDNPEYGFEVNWVEYEDENYIHVDADDGCGNRHIQLVFLKSEEIKSGEWRLMQTELVLGVTLGVGLTEPRLKKGYDMRIATGESHEEIIEGLSVMLTRLVEELFREEFNEDGMTTRVERL